MGSVSKWVITVATVAAHHSSGSNEVHTPLLEAGIVFSFASLSGFSSGIEAG
jgi:hypothetical protein